MRISTSSIIFILVSVLTTYSNSADICEILDANYCFYFSDISCYIELCHCDACSNFDKIRSLLNSESNSNSTRSETLCPTWCPHIKTNETIINILEASKNNETTAGNATDISFDCNDLEVNCLSGNGYNGHCYFYEKKCDFKAEIAVRGKTKPDQKKFKQCTKFQKKCHEKYPRHYACRQLKKKCRGVKLPEIVDNNQNGTLTDSINTHSDNFTKSPLEQCINYRNICSRKWSKHFACKQFNKKCKQFSLPPVTTTEKESGDEVTTKKPKKHHHKKNHHHNHHKNGTNEENETTTVRDHQILKIANETIII